MDLNRQLHSAVNFIIPLHTILTKRCYFTSLHMNTTALILVCTGGSSVTCTKAEQNVDCKLYEGSDNVSAARRYPNTQT